MNVLSEKLTSSLARLNERINEVCPPRVQLGPNVEPIRFRFEIGDDAMAYIFTEGLRTSKVPFDDLQFFIEAMLEALDLVETLNT